MPLHNPWHLWKRKKQAGRRSETSQHSDQSVVSCNPIPAAVKAGEQSGRSTEPAPLMTRIPPRAVTVRIVRGSVHYSAPLTEINWMAGLAAPWWWALWPITSSTDHRVLNARATSVSRHPPPAIVPGLQSRAN